MEQYPYIYDQKIISYKYDKVHPILEIIRHNFLIKIFNNFYNIVRQFNNRIIKPKTIDFITRFVWKNITNIDPVIPYREDNKYNYTQLIIDLKNYNCDAHKILSKFNLDNKLKKFMLKFDNFYNTFNFTNKNKVKINSDTHYLIYKKKYKVKYNDIILKKLSKYYNYHTDVKGNIIFCLLYRYAYLDADNQQLAINLNFKKNLQQHFNIDIEMFGSGINRFFNNYCSLFYDIEKYFGSLGNFFNINPIQGFYMANPPYDEELMENMAISIVNALDNTKYPLGFIITVPIWDHDTSKLISKTCNSKISQFPTYRCKEIFVNSPYLYKEYIFCASDFLYYSFMLNKLIAASPTYIFVVKNKFLTYDVELFENLLKDNKLNTFSK